MGVMALELMAGSTPRNAALTAAEASALAEKLGRDLASLVPQVRDLDLVIAAAHFDPAEALRPGWSLHQRLRELHQRAPGRGEGPRVIAFGADETGDIPLPLQADEGLRGGLLRVVPFLLAGDDHTVDAVGERLESVLLETGMAQPDTALLAQTAFGAQIEHARYMTLHDLAAMTAMQYEHGGLGALWPVCAYYPSPGGSDERVHLFVGRCDSVGAGGIHGLEEEGEDIRVHVLPFEDALARVRDGRIDNAASIMALQWLALNRDEVRGLWT